MIPVCCEVYLITLYDTVCQWIIWLTLHNWNIVESGADKIPNNHTLMSKIMYHI
jgi:hypothetical protein